MFLEFAISPFNMRKKFKLSSPGNRVDFSGNRVDFHLLVGKPVSHFGNRVDIRERLFGKLGNFSGNEVGFSENRVGCSGDRGSTFLIFFAC